MLVRAAERYSERLSLQAVRVLYTLVRYIATMGFKGAFWAFVVRLLVVLLGGGFSFEDIDYLLPVEAV